MAAKRRELISSQVRKFVLRSNSDAEKTQTQVCERMDICCTKLLCDHQPQDEATDEVVQGLVVRYVTKLRWLWEQMGGAKSFSRQFEETQEDWTQEVCFFFFIESSNDDNTYPDTITLTGIHVTSWQ